MARTLTSLAAMFLGDKAGFRTSLKSPVLIWKAPPTGASPASSLGTSPGGQARPESGQALVFDVAKDPGKKNAFAMGVTIGRIESNDIPFDDESVSRFHAWIQHEAKSGWLLSDAESSNGTFCDGAKLEPTRKVPLKNKSKLRFGDVEVTFLSVEGLLAMMEQMIRP